MGKIHILDLTTNSEGLVALQNPVAGGGRTSRGANQRLIHSPRTNTNSPHRRKHPSTHMCFTTLSGTKRYTAPNAGL
eukprot:1195268-Prorocentrum_minimum.AAC.7